MDEARGRWLGVQEWALDAGRPVEAAPYQKANAARRDEKDGHRSTEPEASPSTLGLGLPTREPTSDRP